LIAVREGHELIRQGLESVIQDQAEEVEKRGRPPERVLAEELAHIAAERRKVKKLRRPSNADGCWSSAIVHRMDFGRPRS